MLESVTYQKILAIYLDEQGEFAKPAIELLSQNKVLFGTIQDVLKKTEEPTKTY